jgi:competence protein ComEC
LLIDAGAAKGMVIEESDPGNLIMEFDAGEKVLLPYIKKYNINLEGIIITHHHSDHFGGVISLLEKGIIPKWIMDNGVQSYHPEFYKLLVMMKEKNVEYKQFKLGKLNLDPEVEIEILAPMTTYSLTEVDRAENNSSIVLKVKYKNFSALFTGDIETFAEMDLLEYKDKLRSTVLKVPHHGSATSSSLPFLEMVLPEVGIISCGRGNPFGHPHEDTIVKLNNLKVKTYRTDYNGNITIITDGNKYKVNVEKEY